MPSLVEFLKHVLPSDGYKGWVALKKGERPHQGFTQSFEDLATVLQGIDARGWDAYFACAAYKEPVNRKAENVKAAQSFWLDIDCGEKGHGRPAAYPDADSAVAALDSFCATLQLPYPTVVYSGGGIHAYWRCARELDPAAWLSLASKLKRDTRACGLFADASRTADIASILRPPGTFNWKLPDTPRPVECFELMDGFFPAAESAAVQSGAPILGSSLVGKAFGGEPEKILNIDLGTVVEEEPHYAFEAVQKCEQLRHFRDMKGNIEEPLWYAGLSVLSRFADGEQTAHQWSSGHPNYTPEETARKLQQAHDRSGPTTCERFRSLNPKNCEGCPFTVTSPVTLGKRVAGPPIAPATASAPITAPAPPPTEWPAMPQGYGINSAFQMTAKIKQKKEDGTFETYGVPFTNYPIFLVEVRDGETERAQSYFFRQWEITKGWLDFEISGKNFEAMGVWGALAEAGIRIAKKQRPLFLDYIDACYAFLKTQPKNTRYDQFGWKDDNTAFYYAGVLYKMGGARAEASGSVEILHRSQKMRPSRQGSLANWTLAANRLFIDGCEAQSFALLASFASPLMWFVTPPGEGGVILSLMSPGGGSGKSTTLTAIASVWGELDAIRLLSRDTMVAKFRSMGTLCCLPIVFDELRGRHPELITEFVESFTTGRDRMRGRTDGSVNPVEMSWRAILISASNKSLLDALTAKGDDPLSNRVFEVEVRVPANTEYSLGNELGEDLLLNRGYAGRAYIDYLLQPGVLDFCRDQLRKLIKHYTAETEAKPEHRFIIRLLACIAVAGALVRRMGLLEFSEERIMAWAVEEVRKTTSTAAKFNPVRIVNEIINACTMTSCLVVDGAAAAGREVVIYQKPTRELHMRYELDKKRLYVSTSFIKGKLQEAGAPSLLTANELERQKILLNRSRITTLGGGTSLTGGKVPCWELDMSHPLIGESNLKEITVSPVAKTG